MARSVTLADRVRRILRENSHSAKALRDRIIVELCDGVPEKFVNGVQKHGTKIESEIQRLLEKGDLRIGTNLNLELTG